MRSFLVANVLLTLPAALHAQRIPGPPPTAAECSAAVTALAAAERWGSSWGRIPECGVEGGLAIANALNAVKTVTDSIYLRYLLGAASSIRDGNVWQAAITLSGDKTATLEARVIGLLVLLNQHDVMAALRLDLSWNQLMTVPRATCRFASDLHAAYLSDNSLPRGAVIRAAAHFDAVEEDFTNPAVVRTVAECARVLLRDEVPETVDPALIRLSYVCDTKFRVTNLSSKWIDVSYQVRNTDEHGDYAVGPQSEEMIWTDEIGTVVLFYLGKAIRTAANGGTAC